MFLKFHAQNSGHSKDQYGNFMIQNRNVDFLFRQVKKTQLTQNSEFRNNFAIQKRLKLLKNQITLLSESQQSFVTSSSDSKYKILALFKELW